MFFLMNLLGVMFFLHDCEVPRCSCDPSSPHPPSIVEFFIQQPMQPLVRMWSSRSAHSLSAPLSFGISGHILRVRNPSPPSPPSVLTKPACASRWPAHSPPPVRQQRPARAKADVRVVTCSFKRCTAFHRCGVDRGRQCKCVHASVNVRLNSSCRFFTGSSSHLQAASLLLRLLCRLDDFLTHACHHGSLLSFLVCLLAPLDIMLKTSSTSCTFLAPPGT